MRGTAASPADGWGTTACFRLAPRGALACPRPAIFMGTNLCDMLVNCGLKNC